ncbi:MAG: hypothetical protein ACR2PH_00090, partial [Desulfobulbia bacterium]
HILTQQQKNFWIDQFEELAEAGNTVVKDGELSNSSIYQEYPATPEEAFKAIRDGAYYADAYQKHVLENNRKITDLWDPNLEVEVHVDLGMDDFFVLVFTQIWEGNYRIIHEYVNNGFGIKHYVDYMKAQTESGETIEGHPCENYTISAVYLPWDAEVRDLTTGLSRKDRFFELGVRSLVILPKLPINTGIELVRKLIPLMWIDESCTYINNCMLNYSKEWDEKMQKWKDKPLHNEFSHGADVIRGLAVSRNSGKQTIHSKSMRKKRNSFVVDGMAL